MSSFHCFLRRLLDNLEHDSDRARQWKRRTRKVVGKPSQPSRFHSPDAPKDHYGELKELKGEGDESQVSKEEPKSLGSWKLGCFVTEMPQEDVHMNGKRKAMEHLKQNAFLVDGWTGFLLVRRIASIDSVVPVVPIDASIPPPHASFHPTDASTLPSRCVSFACAATTHVRDTDRFVPGRPLLLPLDPTCGPECTGNRPGSHGLERDRLKGNTENRTEDGTFAWAREKKTDPRQPRNELVDWRDRYQEDAPSTPWIRRVRGEKATGESRWERVLGSPSKNAIGEQSGKYFSKEAYRLMVTRTDSTTLANMQCGEHFSLSSRRRNGLHSIDSLRGASFLQSLKNG